MAETLLVDQPSAKPTRKVKGATLGSAASVLLVWGLSKANIPLPEEVSWAVNVIMTFMGGYFIRSEIST